MAIHPGEMKKTINWSVKGAVVEWEQLYTMFV